MNASETAHTDLRVPARDGYPLAATLYGRADRPGPVVVINSATAVPRRFYRHYAAALAAAGYRVVTYDYRGTGESRPDELRGFEATLRDWVFHDMSGVLDWVVDSLAADPVFFVGHSFGGQAAGLLDRSAEISGLITMSAQSGHWRLQGGEQKWLVMLHAYVGLPLLSHLAGYMPWGRFGGGEDLPRGVALEWARWCRHPDYLLGDAGLPLERYRRFGAPVLAYSFGDDKWGTPRAVDAMMRAYPTVVRRHIEPRDVGLKQIGHVGFFRPESAPLWADSLAWLDALAGQDSRRR